MQIDPELLALITGVLGALLALLWKWLESKYTGLPSLYEILDVIGAIVLAARENHDLKDNEARLDWALEYTQNYLDAKGVGKAFNARVLVEYALEIIKQREEARVAEIDY